MRFKIIVFILSSTFVISCDENKNISNKNVEDAFAKIDKKNESLFTKEDRKKNYQKSISAAEENKKSIANNNVIYNGYGSSPKKKKRTEIKTTNKTNNKVNYKSSAPVTYSAYSTN